MTRAELLTQLGYLLSKNPTLDTATSNRLIGHLNRQYRRLLSFSGAQHLRDETCTFTSVVDQYRYALANVAKINRITDASNRRRLVGMTLDQQRLLEPDPTMVSGLPVSWAWLGYQPVAKHPSDPSELFVVSTSAADVQGIFVDGEITGGYPRVVTRALTGTTAASMGTAVTTWERVHKFYLASAAAGIVTLLEDSGVGTELARIGIGQTRQRYFVIQLWPTPSEVTTYTVDYTEQITELAQDTDEPRLPVDFHDLLLLGALADEYQYLSDTRYAVAANEYGQRMREFKYWMHQTAAEPTRVGQGVEGEFSRLGGWYPAGT